MKSTGRHIVSSKSRNCKAFTIKPMQWLPTRQKIAYTNCAGLRYDVGPYALPRAHTSVWRPQCNLDLYVDLYGTFIYLWYIADAAISVSTNPGHADLCVLQIMSKYTSWKVNRRIEERQ
jgi:hypothetical protein